MPQRRRDVQRNEIIFGSRKKIFHHFDVFVGISTANYFPMVTRRTTPSFFPKKISPTDVNFSGASLTKN